MAQTDLTISVLAMRIDLSSASSRQYVFHALRHGSERSSYCDDRLAAKPHAGLVAAALSACAFWLLASCGHGSPGNNRSSARLQSITVSGPTLQSITISPQNATVAAGLTQQYEAKGNYSDGSSKPLSNATWATSNARLATIHLKGLAVMAKEGEVTVTATVGAVTGKALLTVGLPDADLLTAPRRGIVIVATASEGQIPADFTIVDGMKSFYGNFDPSTQTSVSPLPAGSEDNSFFDKEKGIAGIQVRPFLVAQAKESGTSKVFLGTYGAPLPNVFACHGCAPLISLAMFTQAGTGWVIESSTRTALFGGQWGKPPDQASIVRIGPEHVGVKLEGLCAFCSYVSILIPWKGEIRQAFNEIIAEGNGQVCGDEEGMQPCVGTHKTIAFVKGANPSYDDIVLTLSGTKLTEQPPYKVVEVSGTERRTFSDGKYMPLR